jgi:HEAT repeat protein
MNKPRSLFLCGVLGAAGLMGLAWSVKSGAATDGRPIQRPGILATPMSVMELLQALKDPRREVRLEAIHYLEVMNRPARETAPALARLFTDPDVSVRIHAARAAIKAGLPAAKGFRVAIQALSSKDEEARCLGADVLAEIGRPARAALPILHKCLRADSTWVRLHAADAILSIDPNDTAPITTVQAVLTSAQGPVREYAATIIQQATGSSPATAPQRTPVRVAAGNRQDKAQSASAQAVNHAGLTDSTPLARAKAANAAFRAGAPAERIVPALAELILPDNLEVLRLATTILGDIGPDAQGAIPRLYECLQEPSTTVRLHAAETILRIDPTDACALEELRLKAQHQRTDVRYFAINALGAAVPESSLAAITLHEALCDSSPNVATSAALLLSRTTELSHDAWSSELLESAAEARSLAAGIPDWTDDLSHLNPNVRRRAAIRLALVGSAASEAESALIERLDDSSPAVRLHAARALWEITGEADPIMPTLTKLVATDEGHTRLAAISTLASTGSSSPKARKLVTKLLADSSAFEQMVVAESLINIDPSNRQALEVLVKNVQSTNPEVRYLATVALGAVPLDKQLAAEEALCSSIVDRSARVRIAAYETLSQLSVRLALSPVADGEDEGTESDTGASDEK